MNSEKTQRGLTNILLLDSPRKRILRQLFECNIVFPTMVEKRADVYKVMVGYAPVE